MTALASIGNMEWPSPSSNRFAWMFGIKGKSSSCKREGMPGHLNSSGSEESSRPAIEPSTINPKQSNSTENYWPNKLTPNCWEERKKRKQKLRRKQLMIFSKSWSKHTQKRRRLRSPRLKKWRFRLKSLRKRKKRRISAPSRSTLIISNKSPLTTESQLNRRRRQSRNTKRKKTSTPTSNLAQKLISAQTKSPRHQKLKSPNSFHSKRVQRGLRNSSRRAM